jgi:amphi-Trp domain-containing protein
MKKNEIEVKKSLGVEAVAVLLEGLASSLREGTICVENGGEFVTLKPAEPLELEFEARQKKSKGRLTLELNWREIIPCAQVQTTFKISSKEPEAATEPDVEAAPGELAASDEAAGNCPEKV